MRKLVTSILFMVLISIAALFFLKLRMEREEQANLLLITVDTLVPQHLGCYGYRRPTSPGIDRLSQEGVRFETCYSVAGWTLPAVATILTGRYPAEHGATDFHYSMNDDIATIASVLRRAGYSTSGFVSHEVLKPIFGMAKGFAHYDYSVLNIGHPHDVSTSRELTDLVIDDLKKIEKPFFVWVHYFDPHFEYLSHKKWAYFGNSDLDRYDQEIAYTDFHISRLLDYLRRKGLYKNTVIIFTSDHGEEFGEHGGKFHYTLYEEVMKVPLIMKAPNLKPQTITTTAEQIDILPTALSLLGIDHEAGLPGKELFSSQSSNNPIFMERDRPPPYNQRGMILGNYKLIAIELADTSRIPISSRGTFIRVQNVIPGYYLYDLAGDPLEKKNMFSTSDPGARKLLSLLADYMSRKRIKAKEVTIDEKLNEKLRSLGYIR